MSLRLSQTARSACIVLAAVPFAAAFAWGGALPGALIGLALAGAWLFDPQKRWRHLASITLATYALLGALGFWLGLPMPLLVLSITAVLAAWDLDDFIRRVQTGPAVIGVERLEQQHLRQLGITAGVGLAVALLALVVQFNLGFWALFFAALVMVVSLMQMLALMRRGG